MCRMLLAVGKFEAPILFEGLKCMALDQNERHEENQNESSQHGDGWGMTYLNENTLTSYKSPLACYDDPQFATFSNISTQFLVIHARRASRGSVSESNSHPFLAAAGIENYFFFHNGTIYEDLPFSAQFNRSGTTDSEMLFYHILTHFQPARPVESLNNIFKNITKFSAVNTIFGNNRVCFLIIRFQTSPKYYTMKILADENSLIISSEVLPGLSSRNWEKFSNGTLLKIPVNNPQILFEKYQLLD